MIEISANVCIKAGTDLDNWRISVPSSKLPGIFTKFSYRMVELSGPGIDHVLVMHRSKDYGYCHGYKLPLAARNGFAPRGSNRQTLYSPVPYSLRIGGEVTPEFARGFRPVSISSDRRELTDLVVPSMELVTRRPLVPASPPSERFTAVEIDCYSFLLHAVNFTSDEKKIGKTDRTSEVRIAEYEDRDGRQHNWCDRYGFIKIEPRDAAEICVRRACSAFALGKSKEYFSNELRWPTFQYLVKNIAIKHGGSFLRKSEG